MIVLDRVSFAYGGKPVLEECSLTIPKQGITVLQGPSGCGKTTLLRLLAGLERPQRGTISGLSPQSCAMLFQENRLLPWRTVEQHITDVLPRERREGWEAWLELVELETEAARRPAQLSGGMGRRLALGTVLRWGARSVCWTNPLPGWIPPGRRGSWRGCAISACPSCSAATKAPWLPRPTGCWCWTARPCVCPAESCFSLHFPANPL